MEFHLVGFGSKSINADINVPKFHNVLLLLMAPLHIPLERMFTEPAGIIPIIVLNMRTEFSDP